MNTAESSCSGFTCPLTGFNFYLNRKFLTGALAVIIWSNLFSWLWHGIVLANDYMATASLWRGPQDMDPMLLNGGISLMAFFFTYIFMKGYTGSGVGEGWRFGILMTLLFAGMSLITYATQPIPKNILYMWTLGDFILYTTSGILLSMIFGRKD